MLAALVSQVIARALVRHNFYDEVLIQDGHQMQHVVPPRDLRSWQNLPISAIANFSPVAIENVSEANLRELLEKHPYRHFPVLEEARVKGVVARPEIESAMAEHRALRLLPAREGNLADSIRASQLALIESPSGTLVLTERFGGKMLAMVTLHDLLRAQISMSER
jgi:CIC family chloride channel protein